MPGRKSSRSRGKSKPNWNLLEIQQLIDVLIDREINEFEMEKAGVRISIKRGNSSAGSPAALDFRRGAFSSEESAPPAPATARAAPHSTPAEVEAASLESSEELYIIKSPIVGTFYAAPATNAPPFVKLGDVVEEGRAVCIIEAMKLMNEIESEATGEIVRIYVENGQPVEYGQSLFAIKPSLKK